MLYLYRSCGPAAEWSQRDSCSGLLSLNHDTCYHSRHCSLHRSLQGNKHLKSEEIHLRLHVGLLLSPHQCRTHADWCYSEFKKAPCYMKKFFFSWKTSRNGFLVFRITGKKGKQDKKGSWMLQLYLINTEGNEEMLVHNERRNEKNILNQHSQKLFFIGVCSVCRSVYKCVHVCFFLVKVNLRCLMSTSPSSWGQRFDFQTDTDKTAMFSWFGQKPLRHSGDIKAISATWLLCGSNWFEKKEEVS